MSNFWDGVTGDETKAFSGGFQLIPNNTLAISEIQSFVHATTPQGEAQYEIKWKIIGEEYKNRLLFQKIRAFSSDDNKALRARNMLMLLFNMFDINLPHSGAPQNDDLLAFQGKIASIVIKTWEQEGKSGNWVSEVHPAEYVSPVISGTIDSAFSRNPRPTLDSDIPL